MKRNVPRLEQLIVAVKGIESANVDPQREIWTNADVLLLVAEIERLRKENTILKEWGKYAEKS